MENPAVRNPRRQTGGIGVDRFVESSEKYIAAGEKRPRLPGGREECITFYKLDDDADSVVAGELYHTMMVYAGIDEDMDDQMCAFVLSAVNIWFPMFVVIEDFMKSLNWKVQVLNYPSQKPPDFPLVRAPKWRDILVSFAQVILIFFKNISDVNYNTYMLKRVQAIKSFISYKDAADTILAVEVDRAKVIRRVLGGDMALKKEILEYLLTVKHQASALGRMCTYLSGILAWNEMTYLIFMFEELLLANSPVLWSPEVVGEVRYLSMAYLSVLRHAHPQYYKILVNTADQKMVDRNRFPTLIEVSRRLKEGKSVSAQHFQGSSNVNPDTLNRLLALHRGRHQPISKLVNKSIEFLTGNYAVADGYMGLMNDFMEEV